MERPDRTCRRATVSTLVLVLASCLLCRAASAETRSAATTVAITVERHAAVILPAENLGLVHASTASDSRQGPAALGNGSPTLCIVQDSRPVSAASSRSARVAVTVFEP